MTARACFGLCALGCATYNPHLTATPTAPGTSDWGVTADALVVDRGFGPELLAAPDVSFRRGLGDGWDLGARVFPAGAELSARHCLHDADGYVLSLVPLLAAGVVTGTNADTSFFATSAGAVALNGFRLSERGELVFGLRAQLELGLNAVAVHEDFSEANWRVVSGGQLTYAHRLSRRWSLAPGVVVLVPYDFTRSKTTFPIIQGGLSAGF